MNEPTRTACIKCGLVLTLVWATPYDYGWVQVAHLDRPNEWLCPKCKREVKR